MGHRFLYNARAVGSLLIKNKNKKRTLRKFKDKCQNGQRNDDDDQKKKKKCRFSMLMKQRTNILCLE